jgi:hypothetical protein
MIIIQSNYSDIVSAEGHKNTWQNTYNDSAYINNHQFPSYTFNHNGNSYSFMDTANTRKLNL